MLVAVYGTLRRRGRWNYLLGKSPLLGETTTPPSYTMFWPQAANYPHVVDRGDTPITVEVYDCPADVVDILDNLESVPYNYVHHQVETTFGPALMYVAAPRVRDLLLNSNPRRVVSGNWMDFPENLEV